MSSLTQYEPLVDSTTAIFLAQTEKLFVEQGKSCDFAKWLQFYAFDVIGEMTYSKRHGFVEENKDIDGIIAYIGNLFSYVAPVSSLTSMNYEVGLMHKTGRPNTMARLNLSEESHLLEISPMGHY